MLGRRSTYSVRPEDFSEGSLPYRGDYPIHLLTKRDFGLGAAEIIENRGHLPCQIGFGRTARRAHVTPS